MKRTNAMPTYKKRPTLVASDIIFDHAAVHNCYALADGLFRPIQKGCGGEHPLDITYTFKENTIRWSHPTECLGIKDQSVFLALLRIASEPSRATYIESDNQETQYTEARTRLCLELKASGNAFMVINTSARELAKTSQVAINANALTRIQASLLRLSEVTQSISRDGPCYWRSQMISVLNLTGNKLLVALNPMLTSAVMVSGDKNTTPRTYVSMAEQGALKLEASKRLHFWACGWLRPTESQRVKLDTLIPHIWPESANGDAHYSRRSTLKSALQELSERTSWQCKLDEKSNSVFIQRPQLR